MSAASPLLRLIDVEKVYPNGTVALRGVDLTLDAGEIHGLVGANGAGKSTLIKILTGAIPPTAGEILWKGRQCSWTGPADAKASGIAAIYQHIPLVPTLSVLENVYLSRAGWRYDRRSRLRDFNALLDRIRYEIDPDALVQNLPIGLRQMTALLQALARGADLIIMDEPTASLSHEERQVVFRVVGHLSRAESTAFLYISHYLDEVLRLTSTVTVLRDGAAVATGPTASFAEQTLIRAIAGRALAEEIAGSIRPTAPHPIPRLTVSGLSSPGRLVDVSMSVAAGEIVGVAGLLGSGRSELLHAIFGDDRRRSGAVTVDGRPVEANPTVGVRAGIALVPEDRIRQGLIPEWEIWRNVTLPSLGTFSAGAWVLDTRRERQRAIDAIRELRIVAHSVEDPVSSLSGGNAQKVAFAKWTSGREKVLLLDEPTVGVDVGAKADILALIRRLADEGQAVVMVSSEFEELLAVCDRVLVLREGRCIREYRACDVTKEELLAAASGIDLEDGSAA
ncbi:sugar ABC transporter ATP-binding protein [bacterium]|nr:MAG: sugar ABC transporter ATP-binding protein [bacterium]